MLSVLSLTSATAISADDADHALNCYIASLMGGMQLEKDGDSRAQTYLNESSHWQPKLGRYATPDGQADFENAVNQMAQDKYLYEMLDIADSCRWEREGANQAVIDQRMDQKIAAEQARLRQQQDQVDAERAHAQAETDQQCIRIIDSASATALDKYKTAMDEVQIWMATQQYGQNYGVQTLKDGCEVLDSAWSRINSMGCSQEVYNSFRDLYNNYAITLPNAVISCRS